MSTSTNLEQLILRVSAATGYTQKSVSQILRTAFGEMSEELLAGGSIQIYQFGKFELSSLKPYLGRNPKTGEPVQIPKRRTVRFRLSGVIKKRLKGN